MKRLLLLLICILAFFSGCSGNGNKTLNQPVLFNKKLQMGMCLSTFESFNKNSIKNKLISNDDSNVIIYECTENIFAEECNVEYTFEKNELYAVQYNLETSDKNVNNAIEKIKNQIINTYKISKDGIKKDSENTYSFNTYEKNLREC